MLTTNSVLLRPVPLRSQLAIFENKAKKNLHYFRKTLYRRCLTELSIFLEVLNISVFWIWLWFWICEGSEYARVLNITRLDRLLNVSEYPWIIPEECFNMPKCWALTRPYSDRSREGCNLTYLKNSAKRNLHYFRKTLYGRCVRGLWVYLQSWIYQRSEYGSGSEYRRVMNIPCFWIYQGSEYVRILNMPGFWIYQGHTGF